MILETESRRTSLRALKHHLKRDRPCFKLKMHRTRRVRDVRVAEEAIVFFALLTELDVGESRWIMNGDCETSGDENQARMKEMSCKYRS